MFSVTFTCERCQRKAEQVVGDDRKVETPKGYRIFNAANKDRTLCLICWDKWCKAVTEFFNPPASAPVASLEEQDRAR